MNILMIGSDYLSSVSSNGACMRNLSNEFVGRGHKVTVISSGVKDNIKGFKQGRVNVYTIKHPWFTLFDIYTQSKRGVLFKVLFIIARLIHDCFVFISFPNTARKRTKRVQLLSEKIIREEDIELVLCTSRPTDSIYAGFYIRRKFPEVHVVSYHFDILSSNKDSFISKYKRKREESLLIKELSLFDKVLVPESACFQSSSNNLYYVGFPMYIPSFKQKESAFDFGWDYINISYVGSLDKENRNIEYCIRIIEEVNKSYTDCRLFLNVWGRMMDGDTVELINNCKYAKYHGTLNSSDCDVVLHASDFLLNIGNGVTYNLIPSKIFQLFAIKKPIINIKRNLQDCTCRFFEKYGDAITIEEYNKDLIGDAAALHQFCLAPHSLILGSDVFISYSPSYISDIILG